MTGAVAGLIQDTLSTGIVGIGGLAKTTVGFLTGIVGTQFIVAQWIPRFVVFLGATALHQAITIGLGVLLNLRPFEIPYAATGEQALGNALAGVLAFQMAEVLPREMERRRARR
jgi:rod shape-determining protein MreD